MSAKHFFTDPTHLVQSALSSLVRTNPLVDFDADSQTIHLSPNASNNKPTVSLVSGGGSGHEPSFAAFVGPGLLSAAVAGTIFASPSASQIRHAILNLVEHRAGILVIVMNYTGDVLNFGMAVEKARAAGTEVDMVVVADDVGVGREQGGKVGRRGIAGTCLVLKITGAMAARGASLNDVAATARCVSANVASIGASLAHVHVPGRSVEEFSDTELPLGEVEVGMGIHNEPGAEKIKADLPQLVEKMLKHLLDATDKDRGFVKFEKGDRIVVLINNLGGLSPLELGGITTEVLNQLKETWAVSPVRVLAGTYMTSLNGLGFSISLLRLVDQGMPSGISMLDLLDAPAEATGWAAPISAETWSMKREPEQQRKAGQAGEKHAPSNSNLQLETKQAKSALTAGLNSVIKAEPEITKYDTVVGDGDCGTGMKRGAEAILKWVESTKDETTDAASYVDEIAKIVEGNMDGTSGALYAIFLNALANGIRQQSVASSTAITPEKWAEALQSAFKALRRYTPAQPGDRTVVDALEPFVSTLASTKDVGQAASAAEKGAASTQGMRAMLGRTTYVGGDGWQKVPDPGAYGLSQFFRGLVEGLH